MITRIELEKYLAEHLETERFDDYCVNGLQVEGRDQINKIVTGVSASERLFQEAIEVNADAILVHHGLFWKTSHHPFRLTGIMQRRVKLLLDKEINLFCFHLPLDSHTQLGNNILIARALGIQEPNFVFAESKKNLLAVVGELDQPLDTKTFRSWADEKLDTQGHYFPFGKTQINSLYILSGGGAGFFQDAVDQGVDLMITGELTEPSIRAAEECGLALYAAGHYNSEKWGIKALGEHLSDQFGLESRFIDIPNPI